MNYSDKNNEYYQNLILKNLTDEANESEKIELNDWLSKSEQNKYEFQKIEKIWLNASVNENIDVDLAWEKVYKSISETKIIPFYKKNFWYSVAATIVLLIGIIFLYQKTNSDIIIVSNLNTESIQLTDNTNVYLNKHSQLSYNDDYNQKNRKVELKGEAFFDVTKIPNKPFIIETEFIKVTVLGTSFFVKESSDSVIVSVVSGKVHMEDITNSKNYVLLKAYNSAIFIKSSETIFKTDSAIFNKYKWREKLFIFNNSTLNKVIKELNSAFKVNITFENKALENCKLTATFKDQKLDEILEVIKTTFDLEVIHHNNSIELKGHSCE